MNIKDRLGKSRLYLDGSMGTMLQNNGLAAGELPERWNVTHPEKVIAVHTGYLQAGSEIISTNTFGANRLKYDSDELRAVISAGVACAREAIRRFGCEERTRYVALDIGPLGRLLKPYGDLDFEDAVSLFAETVRIGVSSGVDLILIETMNDIYEAKAAVLAAKEEGQGLPVFATCAFGEDLKLLTGATPKTVVSVLEGLQVDALGTNCSLGPEALLPVVLELTSYASVPVIVKPNAGLPRQLDGKTVYDVSPADFARVMALFAEKGASLLGGCCGTDPSYISETVAITKDIPYRRNTTPKKTVIASYTHTVTFGDKPVLIGERINPTGKKRFKEALLSHDIDYILKEGLAEEEHGADVLDVNVGLPGIDEPAMLTDAVVALQAVTDLPLQLDSSDKDALESAMRRYNGKPLINSVNGKAESLSAILPLAKKYGGVLVALTLDENGIPADAEGRYAIAERILHTAERYGIDRRDLIFDPLCMAVSADAHAAEVTLEAVRLITERLGMPTVLGVSNVSFGLPNRELVNAAFFAGALENGLSAAIMNPYSFDMMKTYRTFLLLHGMDENCADYISFAAAIGAAGTASDKAGTAPNPSSADYTTVAVLGDAIRRGLVREAGRLASELLTKKTPLAVIDEDIIPSLDEVGRGFEEKKVYLPQLLMSAEAASAAFEKVKLCILSSGENRPDKGKFVLATVKGDIHDIGKNIVRTLLENYGFHVIDLGKDVAPEVIADTVVREEAPFLGLSALMTTTVPAMADTIRLVKARCPACRIAVGGAVLTREYAAEIGADFYGHDAMDTVRFALNDKQN